jgi:hypothetical protein
MANLELKTLVDIFVGAGKVDTKTFQADAKKELEKLTAAMVSDTKGLGLKIPIQPELEMDAKELAHLRENLKSQVRSLKAEKASLPDRPGEGVTDLRAWDKKNKADKKALDQRIKAAQTLSNYFNAQQNGVIMQQLTDPRREVLRQALATGLKPEEVKKLSAEDQKAFLEITAWLKTRAKQAKEIENMLTKLGKEGLPVIPASLSTLTQHLGAASTTLGKQFHPLKNDQALASQAEARKVRGTELGKLTKLVNQAEAGGDYDTAILHQKQYLKLRKEAQPDVSDPGYKKASDEILKAETRLEGLANAAKAVAAQAKVQETAMQAAAARQTGEFKKIEGALKANITAHEAYLKLLGKESQEAKQAQTALDALGKELQDLRSVAAKEVSQAKVDKEHARAVIPYTRVEKAEKALPSAQSQLASAQSKQEIDSILRQNSHALGKLSNISATHPDADLRQRALAVTDAIARAHNEALERINRATQAFAAKTKADEATLRSAEAARGQSTQQLVQSLRQEIQAQQAYLATLTKGSQEYQAAESRVVRATSELASAEAKLRVEREAAKTEAAKLVGDSKLMAASLQRQRIAQAEYLATLKQGTPEYTSAKEGLKNLNQAMKDLRKSAESAQSAIYARGKQAYDKAGGLEGLHTIPKEQQADALSYLNRRQEKLRNAEAGIAANPRLTQEERDARLAKVGGNLRESSEAISLLNRELQGNVGMWHQAEIAMRAFFRYAILYGSGYALLSYFKSLVTGVAEFEDKLKAIQAVTRETDENTNALGASIKEIAGDSRFSLSEVADAAQLIAQAGEDMNSVPSALQATVKLAEAANGSLQDAADTITTFHEVFGIAYRQAADEITAAVNISKLGMEDLKLLANYAAQIAKASGATSNQLLGQAAFLANQGVRKSTIGTGLGRAYTELFSPDDKLLSFLQKTTRQQTGEQTTTEAIRARLVGFREGGDPLRDVLGYLKSLGIGATRKTASGKEESVNPTLDAQFRRAIDINAARVLDPLIKDVEKLGEAVAETSAMGDSAAGAEIRMESAISSFKKLGTAVLNLSDTVLRGAVVSIGHFADSVSNLVGKLDKSLQETSATHGEGMAGRLAGAVTGGLLGFSTTKGGMLARIGGGLAGAAGGLAATNAGEKAAGDSGFLASVGGGAVGALVTGVIGKLVGKLFGALKGVEKPLSDIPGKLTEWLQKQAGPASEKVAKGLFASIGEAIKKFGAFILAKATSVEGIATVLGFLAKFRTQVILAILTAAVPSLVDAVRKVFSGADPSAEKAAAKRQATATQHARDRTELANVSSDFMEHNPTGKEGAFGRDVADSLNKVSAGGYSDYEKGQAKGFQNKLSSSFEEAKKAQASGAELSKYQQALISNADAIKGILDTTIPADPTAAQEAVRSVLEKLNAFNKSMLDSLAKSEEAVAAVTGDLKQLSSSDLADVRQGVKELKQDIEYLPAEQVKKAREAVSALEMSATDPKIKEALNGLLESIDSTLAEQLAKASRESEQAIQQGQAAGQEKSKTELAGLRDAAAAMKDEAIKSAKLAADNHDVMAVKEEINRAYKAHLEELQHEFELANQQENANVQLNQQRLASKQKAAQAEYERMLKSLTYGDQEEKAQNQLEKLNHRLTEARNRLANAEENLAKARENLAKEQAQEKLLGRDFGHMRQQLAYGEDGLPVGRQIAYDLETAQIAARSGDPQSAIQQARSVGQQAVQAHQSGDIGRSQADEIIRNAEAVAAAAQKEMTARADREVQRAERQVAVAKEGLQHVEAAVQRTEGILQQIRDNQKALTLDTAPAVQSLGALTDAASKAANALAGGGQNQQPTPAASQPPAQPGDTINGSKIYRSENPDGSITYSDQVSSGFSGKVSDLTDYGSPNNYTAQQWYHGWQPGDQIFSGRMAGYRTDIGAPVGEAAHGVNGNDLTAQAVQDALDSLARDAALKVPIQLDQDSVPALQDDVAQTGESISQDTEVSPSVGLPEDAAATLSSQVNEASKAASEAAAASPVTTSAALDPAAGDIVSSGVMDAVAAGQDVANANPIVIPVVTAESPSGGSVEGHADGGHITGRNAYERGGTDRIHAMLDHGEYVIPKKAVNHFGVGFFNQLRNLQVPKAATAVPRFAAGGLVGRAEVPVVDSLSRSQSARPALTPVNLHIDGKSYSLEGTPDTVGTLQRALYHQALKQGRR